jgi:hypothetical protein
MLDEKARTRGTTPQTLVDIHHPAFRKGYQDGRVCALQEQAVVTDQDLVELLQLAFDQRETDELEEREKNLYYSIGHILGEVSTRVIPYQPCEQSVEYL